MNSRITRNLIALTAVATVGTAAQAALLTNGDFSTDGLPVASQGNALGAQVDGNHLLFGDLSGGTTSWGTKTIGWQIENGVATRNAAIADAGLGQASAITTETGTDYSLTFDWTAAAGAAGADLNVAYNIVAWKAGPTPVAGDRFFTGLNFGSDQSRVIGAGGSWTDLGDGSVRTGNANAVAGSFVGTAGAAASQTVALNFGGDDIGDFDYIGVRFNAATANGGVLDNIAFVNNTIPEPASLALLGLGGLAMLGRRR